MSKKCEPILSNSEFEELVDGTMERVYLLKVCVEKDVTSLQEMNSVARDLVFTDLQNDTKVWKALCAWNNMWHDGEPYK